MEVQYVKADQEGVCIVEISNMTADLPLRDLFDAKIEIAIICEGAKYSRIRVSAELLWYKKDWKEKNKVAIKTGFLSGCREKYGSLKQACVNGDFNLDMIQMEVEGEENVPTGRCWKKKIGSHLEANWKVAGSLG